MDFNCRPLVDDFVAARADWEQGVIDTQLAAMEPPREIVPYEAVADPPPPDYLPLGKDYDEPSPEFRARMRELEASHLDSEQ